MTGHREDEGDLKPGGERISERDRHLPELKRRARLAQTLAELNVVFVDGADLAAEVDSAFENDMRTQRSARSIINDLHETIERLPNDYYKLIPEQMSRDLRSMRIMTHAYQRIDWVVVQETLRADLPKIRSILQEIPGFE